MDKKLTVKDMQETLGISKAKAFRLLQEAKEEPTKAEGVEYKTYTSYAAWGFDEQINELAKEGWRVVNTQFLLIPPTEEERFLEMERVVHIAFLSRPKVSVE